MNQRYNVLTILYIKQHCVPHKIKTANVSLSKQCLPYVAVFFLPLREQFQRILTVP